MFIFILFNSVGKFILIYNLILFERVRSDDYEYKLIKDLLVNYNPLARPSLSHKHPTNVTFDLSLSQLIDVDEKNQLITTNAWVTMNWIDFKLRWNASKYGGIDNIRLPYDKIWKPDVILYNNADALASMSQISTHMIILNNGSVTWLTTSIYRSSCSIDVNYFPFDQQNCSLSFASWTYDGNSLNLLKLTPGNNGDMSNYLANGEWKINNLLVERHIKIYSCCPNPYPNVTYYIVITRRPLFYVFNMIFPSLLITLVGFLGFLIPPDSGEKISMGVTTLLSMTVFLMAISDSMPPNSDSVPIIAIYYFGSMLIISLATAGTVLTLNIFKKGDGDEPVPEIIQTIFFKFIARILFIKISLNNDLDSSVKKIYTNLKSYYINSSVEKFLYLETLRNLKLHKNNHLRNIEKRQRIPTESIPKVTARISEPLAHEVWLNIDKEKSYLPSKYTKYRKKKAQNKNQDPNNSKASDPLANLLPVNSEYLEANSGKSSHCSTPQNHHKLNSTKQTTEGRLSDVALNISCLRCFNTNIERRRLIKILKSVNDNLEKNELKEIITLYKEELRAQWTQLAQVIDAFLIYMFTLSTFLLIGYLINRVPNERFEF